MQEQLKEYFESLGIEYFAVLDYLDLKETNHGIIAREDFSPRSAVIYLLPYYSGETVNISRYAASRDYHIAIAEVNRGITNLLCSSFSGAGVKGYGDHSPIDERHAALVGGLGILGDNGLLINEKYGSYVFIGDVLTDIAPSELSAARPGEIKRCLSCGLCKRACPTGILRGESVSCLSEITQRKGELSADEISLMRSYNTVWGCDLCQSVCPYNREPEKTPLSFFLEDRIEELTRERLDAMSAGEFKSRAFSWRGRGVLERNLDLLKNVNNNCQNINNEDKNNA